MLAEHISTYTYLPFQILAKSTKKMATYKGFATMYLQMPMCAQPLPVQGTCAVEDKKVVLTFPFSGTEFELPSRPMEGRNDFDFKIRGARGNMTMTIGYIKELRVFTGVGRMDEADDPSLSFVFFSSDSAMNKLKACMGNN